MADYKIQNEHVQAFLDREQGLRAENTWMNKRSTLRNFGAWREEQGLELESMTAADLDRYFVACRKEGYAPNTIKNRFHTIHSLYGYLAGLAGVIDATPFHDQAGDPVLTLEDYTKVNGNGDGSRKRAASEPIYVTPEEVEAMAENVPTPALRNELLVRLLFQTGVRAGELAGIRLEDVDPEERAIDVYGQKTASRRTVFYQPSLDVLLDRWLDAGGRARFLARDADHLFLTGGGSPLAQQDVNTVVKEAAERAGIQVVEYQDQRGNDRHRITAHAFRHGHAVHALKSGIDVRTVQMHLGHSDLEMTMQYLELLDSDVQEAYGEKFA